MIVAECGFVSERVRVRFVEKFSFDPMLFVDRIERSNDLFEPRRFATQTQIQLIDVRFVEFGDLFAPRPRDPRD